MIDLHSVDWFEENARIPTQRESRLSPKNSVVSNQNYARTA